MHIIPKSAFSFCIITYRPSHFSTLPLCLSFLMVTAAWTKPEIRRDSLVQAIREGRDKLSVWSLVTWLVGSTLAKSAWVQKRCSCLLWMLGIIAYIYWTFFLNLPSSPCEVGTIISILLIYEEKRGFLQWLVHSYTPVSSGPVIWSWVSSVPEFSTRFFCAPWGPSSSQLTSEN